MAEDVSFAFSFAFASNSLEVCLHEKDVTVNPLQNNFRGLLTTTKLFHHEIIILAVVMCTN